MELDIVCKECGCKMSSLEKIYGRSFITLSHICPNCDFETFTCYRLKFFGLWKHTNTIDRIKETSIDDACDYGFHEWVFVTTDKMKEKMKRFFLWFLWCILVANGLTEVYWVLFENAHYAYAILGGIILSACVVVYFDLRRKI